MSGQRRDRLTSERHNIRKTQGQVAKDLKISQVYVRKLERGTVKPGRDLMFKIEKYYGVSANLLFPDIYYALDDKKVINTNS